MHLISNHNRVDHRNRITPIKKQRTSCIRDENNWRNHESMGEKGLAKDIKFVDGR